MNEHALSRRCLLRVAGVAAGGVGLAGLATACGGSTNDAASDAATTAAPNPTTSEAGVSTGASAPSTPATASSSGSGAPVTVGGVQLPTYLRFPGVAPD